MKNIIWLIFLLVLTSCKTKDFSKELVGNYEVSGWGGSTKLFLSDSGKFHSEEALVSCLGSDWIDIVKGDYIVQGDYVILKPLTYHVQYYEYDKPVNRKLTWDSTRSLNALRDFYDSLAFLSWNKKIFLLGANKTTVKNPEEFISGGVTHFLNWINSGDTSYFQTHYLSKNCQYCNPKSLEASLPEGWSDYLTKSEIRGKILSIDSIESKLREDIVFMHPYVTIDAGGNQGVHLGYNFYLDSTESITILEVANTFSKGVSYRDKFSRLQIGHTLSTLKMK